MYLVPAGKALFAIHSCENVKRTDVLVPGALVMEVVALRLWLVVFTSILHIRRASLNPYFGHDIWVCHLRRMFVSHLGPNAEYHIAWRNIPQWPVTC